MTKKQEYNPNMSGAMWPETRVVTVHDEKTDKPKIISPAFSGKMMVHGEWLRVKFYPVESDNPKAPAYRFTVSEMDNSASEKKEA